MFASLLFDSGEIIVLVIGTALIIAALATGIHLTVKDRDSEPVVFAAVISVIIALLFGFFAFISAHSHGKTVDAKRELAEVGYDVKSLNVDAKTVTLAAYGCKLQFDLHNTDEDYRPVLKRTDGSITTVYPYNIENMARTGCHGEALDQGTLYKPMPPAAGVNRCDDPATPLIEYDCGK